MPRLVRLYVRSVVAGFVLAALFVALLLWRDVAGLGRLVAGSDIGWIAVLMLVVFNGIVFAAVQFALSVMRLAAPPEGPRGGRPASGRRAQVPVGARVAGPQRPWGR